MTVRIEINHLSVHSAQGMIISDLSLQISDGESLTILGETGSGKSILALAILGNLPPALTASGSVKVDGREMLGISADKASSLWGRTMVMLPQEPWRALSPLMKVRKQVAEVFRFSKKKTGPVASQLADELLLHVGLSGHENKVPVQLSGGMAQRAAIACSAASNAQILLADEPTKGLDADRKSDIVSLLNAQKADGCLLTITHDVDVARALGGKTLVMQKGVVVERGDSETICNQPVSDYARALIGAAPANWPSMPGNEKHHAPLISTSSLVLSRGNKVLLNNVDMTLGEGEIVGLHGASGSGKSSLADALLGLLPVTGKITFHQPLARHQKLKLYQDPPAAFSDEVPLCTLLDDLITLHSIKDASVDTKAAELGLDPALLNRPATEVSGGELQRVALLRAMLLRPKFLVADEPTSRLDPITAEKVTRLLVKNAREINCTLLFISHDLEQLNKVCDRVIPLQQL